MLDADTIALPCKSQDAVPCRKKGSCTHTPACQLKLQHAIVDSTMIQVHLHKYIHFGTDFHLFLGASMHNEQMRSGGLRLTKAILV